MAPALRYRTESIHKRRLKMHSTDTSLSFFIWPVGNQMRLYTVASALVPVLFFFIARADAVAIATTSPTLSGPFSPTEDRSGTVIQLELDTLDETILSNFWFHAWVKYVYDYNLAHPEDKVSIMRKLHEQYGDRKLSMMLAVAARKESPLLRAIGMKLQTKLMSYWKGQNVSPGQLYRMLQSDEHNPRLLIDREYYTWNMYFSNFKPGKSMDHFDQLYHTFGEKELILLLISSTRSKKTEIYAGVFEDKLADEWLRKDMTPEFVFKQLMLDSNPYGLFDHAEIYVWLHYAKMYQRKKRTIVTLNEMLERYYSDLGIYVIIATATTDHGKAYARILAKSRT